MTQRHPDATTPPGRAPPGQHHDPLGRGEQREHAPMVQLEIRPAQAGDARAMAELVAAVADERDEIATEPQVDLDARAARFARSPGASAVAAADGQIIGMLHLEVSHHRFGELAMLVDRGWRGHGVGSALLAAATDWAHRQGLHKLCLEVFPHNAAAIALYRKCGFVEEGRRARQYRRANGELWDSIVIGLPLVAGEPLAQPTH